MSLMDTAPNVSTNYKSILAAVVVWEEILKEPVKGNQTIAYLTITTWGAALVVALDQTYQSHGAAEMLVVGAQGGGYYIVSSGPA